MSISSFAAANGYAIILADTNGNIPAGQSLLGSTFYIIGGPGLTKDISGAQRVYGQDRYSTNAQILSNLPFEYDYAYLANGNNNHLADALVAAPLAAKHKAPIVLTDGSSVKGASTVIGKLKTNSKIIAIGGSTAVSDRMIGAVTGNGSATEDKTATENKNSSGSSSSVSRNNNSADVYTVEVPGVSSDYKVNFILLKLSESYENYTFTLDGSDVSPTPVTADGKIAKIAVEANVTSGILRAMKGQNTVLSKKLTFTVGGKTAPETLYGTVPMSFSEFFYDVTAGISTEDEVAEAGAAFDVSGTVAEPEKFITQGTRSGTPTYADGDKLEKVDAVSSATYGDSVHYIPTSNHMYIAPDGVMAKNADTAITGIAKAEVGVSFDLYANAALLKATSEETVQSENVLAKITGEGFELVSVKTGENSYMSASGSAASGAGIYKPKYMLVDGNWGARSGVLDSAVVKALPADGTGGTEGVTYFGNWGDYMTGYVFDGDLGTEYGGGNYFHNFAEYIYGGYVEDEAGNIEPLVFLQNIFTHLNHTDFDVAISPSRFSRFNNLELLGTLHVTVFVAGFPDIDFEFEIKNYVNKDAVISGGTTNFDVDNSADVVFTISGIDDPEEYAKGVGLYKGSADTSSQLYKVEADTSTNSVKVTIDKKYFTGSYQGMHTLKYETDDTIAKLITFTLVNTATVNLKVGSSGAESSKGLTLNDPINVAKTDTLYFSNNDFASTLVVSGRAGYSTVKEVNATGDGAVFGTAIKRSGDAEAPYYIDLSATVFEAGKTYVLTMIAPGFKNQVYYVEITT